MIKQDSNSSLPGSNVSTPHKCRSASTADVSVVLLSPEPHNLVEEWERSDTKLDMSKSAGGNRSFQDRFIPARSASKAEYIKTFMVEDPPTRDELIGEGLDSSKSVFEFCLKEELLGVSHQTHQNGPGFTRRGILGYGKPTTPSAMDNELMISEKTTWNHRVCLHRGRCVPKSPFKVLDAPHLQDDFYLNLLDWSKNNLLAVGLGNIAYLWRANNGEVSKLCQLGDDDMVTSVHWSGSSSHLAVGTSNGEMQIWDAVKSKKIRTFEGHEDRVGAIASYENVFASGSKDKTILLRDLRCQQDYYDNYVVHKQEVCGLKWSPDGQLLASGGNDNKLYVWTPKSKVPVFKSSAHNAAVKALAWSTHQHGLLASGGGTADKCIRFWNLHTNREISHIDTGSQVCNLMFAMNDNELISTHGYTENQIHLWSYPKMNKLATLKGHTYRVLYLGMSPDGNTIVTGAGDETLRFWDISSDKKPADKTSLESTEWDKISLR